MEDGVLKVVRGAFLAMKGTQQRNLYFLDGYTVIGRAAVSSSSDDEASDTSRLWHMRLGLVGEKALQVNKLPVSALDGKTPKEVWSGQPVSDYDHLHIFGCPTYFHVTESKLDPRAKKVVFVGFSEGVKGFRLWNSESKKIILSRDVTFDESAMLKQTLRDTENENPNSLQQVEFEVPKKSEKASPTVDGLDDQDEISVKVEDSAPLFEIKQQPESIATSRPKRDIRKPARYIDMVAYALSVTDGDVPYTYREAMNSDAFQSAGVLQLTKNQADDQNITSSTGRATYNQPVPIWDAETGRLTDFTTQFSFIIKALDRDNYGDGLSFFLAPYDSKIPPNSSGGFLALFSPETAITNISSNQIVAVEFDSYMNEWDPSDDHVGINVNSVVSVANVTWRSSIKNGSIANAWVSYNSTTKNLSVLTAYSNNPIFSRNYSVSYTVDLREVLPEQDNNIVEHLLLGLFTKFNLPSKFVALYAISAMAALSLNNNFLLNLIFSFLFLSLPIANSVSFNFTSFESNNNAGINFTGDAFPSAGVLQLTKNQLFVNLTNSTGWATYNQPVPIWDSKTGKLTDFTTHFSFIIKAEDTNKYGDGISFFLAPYDYQIPPNSSDGLLALFSNPENSTANQIVAVEFDSFNNTWDPNDNHVGINVNSIVSVANVTWKSSIRNGSTANAWVSYNSSTQNLSVFLTYANNPVFGGNSSLSYIVDLRKILPEQVRIGFSASTGNWVEVHNILSWSFESSLVINNGKNNLGLIIGLVVGKASKESDVYSFGVVALEIACGRKPVDPRQEQSKVRLVEWVWDLYGKEQILKAVDQRLETEFDERQMECLMIVGLWCCHPDVALRPSIRQVINVLNFEAQLPSLPSKLPVAMYFAPPLSLSHFNYTSTTGGLTDSDKYPTGTSNTSSSAYSSMSIGSSKALLNSNKS
ncbi:hypothetical protein LWI28_022237 [Acer negundo]|uniref:Non-specific serine/threonine protein kinase n=1 Tax=Acer negundo TaxID=4023 RepID=A0AAD5IJ66_ACENE|nr:hypothetical protein LWI28_022237 [Acer negundo]